MKRQLLLAPIAALVLAACSGKGNSGKLEIDPALIEQVPWINGRGPILDADGMAIVPGDPLYPDIASGTADPGSRSFDPARSDLAEDCAPLADVELSGWRHDFEPTEPGFAGVAQFWSGYLDYTDGAWLVPGDASWYPNIALKRNGTIWGLASQPIGNGPQCADDVPNTHALHVKGGRFNGFGGGVEHPLSLDCGGHQPRGVADLCTPDAVLNELLDLTAYDGIAFWARRGPEGSSGLQVGIQTKDTSDFLARSGKLGPVNCERIKTCQATCDNGGACTLFTQNGFEATPRYRCIPEDADPNLTLEPSLLEFLYPQCGIDTCKGPPYFADPDHEKTDDPSECKAYTFSGLEEGTWCFGKDPPAAPTERCGDGFASNVSLSTDWKFFKLPFANFRQVGFAKRADRFDLKNVYSIAFQFSVGWADFYVDNVSFYRNK